MASKHNPQRSNGKYLKTPLKEQTLLALEPRMMLDAALATSVVDSASDSQIAAG